MAIFNQQRLHLLGATFLVITVAACGGGGGSAGDENVIPTLNPSDGSDGQPGDENGECSSADVKRWVDDKMHDYYLFYDQVPTVNLNDYDSPETLIRALRVAPYDRFSYVNDTAVSDERSEEGKTFGFGYRWKRDTAGIARISQVQPDSPFGFAGVRRGDIIESLGGIAWEDLTNAQYDENVGTRENPLAANWVFTNSVDGTENSVTATATLYDINTVLDTDIFTHSSFDGGVGYLIFDQFLETSEAELDDAMEYFAANDIQELILDLRYNGGGRTSIARQLASQIAGPATNDELLITYQFNDKYNAENFSRFFVSQPHSQGLSRLIVLTTSSTASSSEIVINSLKPYIDVVTIGERTTGKPYITYGRDYCGKRIHALEAEGLNANGVSVYGGVTADCAALDDVTTDFGANNGITEGMLASALDYILDGTCAAPTIQAANSRLNGPVKNKIAQEAFESGAQGF